MMSGSRIEYAAKNFASSTLSNLVNVLLSFAARTVFVYVLGETYLGVNGLFTNVLGMLSLAELGIGSAISFSLYKPLAEGDVPKIQAIINFYKIAYRLVALVVAIIGLCFLPFLQYIINGADEIRNIHLIYCIFLFNTVSSYLISYKATILSADQKNYLLTNINLIIKIVVTVLQIIILMVLRNFIVYLLVDAVVQVVGKVYINHFVNARYPYLKGENNAKLQEEERRTIFTKIKALTMHKVGEVSVNQTDNIITSAFINVATVGIVSNYTMVISAVKVFIIAFFNSATAGLGNLIATEKEEARYQVSLRYDYLGFVFFGWSAIVLYFCLPPFIRIWLGETRQVDLITVGLLCLNYYMMGARVPLANIKIAAGVYEQDRWVPLAQAAANIVVSIIGAKLWGLKGIYIGTLASSMFPNIIRPIVVYKHVFSRTCGSYFKKYLLRLILLLCDVAIIQIILNCLPVGNLWGSLLISLLTSAVIPLVSIYLVTHNTEEFQYVCGLLHSVWEKVRRKNSSYEA